MEGFQLAIKDFYRKIETPLQMYSYLNDDVRNIIDDFIERLPGVQKEFANLRYKEHLTYEEIGEKLDYTLRHMFYLRRKVLDAFWIYIMTSDRSIKVS